MTLDDLAESNPELFNSPRDPDIIHPGEKIAIEGGTHTTVKVTFNGYTMTTRPDGNMTLTNTTTGADRYRGRHRAGSVGRIVAGNQPEKQ